MLQAAAGSIVFILKSGATIWLKPAEAMCFPGSKHHWRIICFLNYKELTIVKNAVLLSVI